MAAALNPGYISQITALLNLISSFAAEFIDGEASMNSQIPGEDLEQKNVELDDDIDVMRYHF